MYNALKGVNLRKVENKNMTNDMDSSLPEGSEGQPNLTPSDGNVQPSSEAVTILKSDPRPTRAGMHNSKICMI